MANIAKTALLNRIKNDFEYHKPKDEHTADLHVLIRNECRATAHTLVKVCPEGRELSTALTKLEEAMMWANAALARNQ